MIISSLPAAELMRILQEDSSMSFGAYCFILTREIIGQEVLQGLFDEHRSFASLSGKSLLVVLFYSDVRGVRQVPEFIKGIPEEERERLLQRLFFDPCDSLRDSIYRKARAFDGRFWGYDDDGWHSHGYGYIRQMSDETALDLDFDAYAAAMTEQASKLKNLLGLSEEDLPSVVIADRKLDEVGVFHLTGEQGILEVYQIMKTVIVRNLERSKKIGYLNAQISQKRNEISQLKPGKGRHRERRAHLKEEVRAMEKEISKFPRPQALSSLASEWSTKSKIKSYSKRAFSVQDLVLRFLQLVAG